MSEKVYFDSEYETHHRYLERRKRIFALRNTVDVNEL